MRWGFAIYGITYRLGVVKEKVLYVGWISKILTTCFPLLGATEKQIHEKYEPQKDNIVNMKIKALHMVSIPCLVCYYCILLLIFIFIFYGSYIDKLSKSLDVEYKHYGIDVQCQVPHSQFLMTFFFFFNLFFEWMKKWSV